MTGFRWRGSTRSDTRDESRVDRKSGFCPKGKEGVDVIRAERRKMDDVKMERCEISFKVKKNRVFGGFVEGRKKQDPEVASLVWIFCTSVPGAPTKISALGSRPGPGRLAQESSIKR
jgi:hypothetical protein